MAFLFHGRNGVVLDEPQFVATMQALAERGQLGSFNLSAIGYFLMEDLSNPEQALTFFFRAIDGTPPDDPFPKLLARELRGKRRVDLAERSSSTSARGRRLLSAGASALGSEAAQPCMSASSARHARATAASSKCSR
ncbi:MAG TPA: hypothetical protein VIG97_03980 [Luteimonas sp.]